MAYMRWKPEDAQVLRLGIDTMLNLCLDKNQSRPVGVLGGVQTVHVAMQAHPYCVELQVSGCAVLLQLALDAECQQRIIDAGTIEVAHQAVLEHQERLGMLRMGCAALLNLASGNGSEVVKSAFLAGVEVI